MSNIAGKAYAMNVITPIRWWTAWVNKLIFWAIIKIFPSTLNGLITLSLIHYARWVIIERNEFPRLADSQPEEDLHYSYMMFFSNFNGSWDQYVDSFSMAIPGGLNLAWQWNILYPKSVPLTKFHRYITHNQIETNHYYNAYPDAASNDIKAALKVKKALIDLTKATTDSSPEDFLKKYNQFLKQQQKNLGATGPSPVISLAYEAVQEKR